MADIITPETLEKDNKPLFPTSSLSKDELKDFQFVQTRILQLQESRKDVANYGSNIEAIWAEADKEYIPHRTNTKGKRIVGTDELLGWRGSQIKVGDADWQSDVDQPNVYTKVQTALSILIDQNPSGVFTPTTKKYEATTELMKQLYTRSWEYAKSKQQLKLFVYNLSKYGWAIGRSYPLHLSRKVKNITEYDPENPQNTKWEEKEVEEYNDIFRENLDPWNCWIDDMTRPSNQFSLRDWAWRKVYSFEDAEEQFGKYPNWKYVRPGGIVSEKVNATRGQLEKKFRETKLVEVLFYENRIKDLYMVIANGVPIVIEPLPVSDTKGIKKLSCWQTFWTLRHAESPYGIGVFEAMRYDNSLLNRMRNMTIDQITLSIYKMFFYQGTSSLTETGDIVIKPGVGKQMLDPKNVQWMEVPGPGQDAYKGMEMLQKDIQDDTGISETLQGTVTGKTAFEIAQAKESALKRLRTPLDNILDALQQEGYITLSLINLLYSIPETFELSDTNKIEDYLREIKGDPELFDRGEGGKFVAKVYREFPLNLEKDEKGNLGVTSDTTFFRVKPSGLQWEGMISIKPQSILTPSKQVDKALELEMWNMLLPLLANPPELMLKPAKAIIKLYDKDPNDILPDSWLQSDKPKEQVLPAPGSPNTPQGEPLIIQQGQGGQPGQPPQAPAGNQPTVKGGIMSPPEVSRGAERLTTNPVLPSNPQATGSKIINKMKKPFAKV